MKKICVYTCITGNYDNLNEIKCKEDNIDYICFTNNKKIKSNSWKIIYINHQKDNIRIARRYKILGAKELDQYDITIWVDGAFIITGKIKEFLKKECDLDKYGIITYKHSKRDCIYDEAIECIKQGKDNKNTILNQMGEYRKEKYPKHNGLAETGIIIRKNNDDRIKKLTKMWYHQIEINSYRDQLSFNYCLYKLHLNDYCLLINKSIYKNGYFEYKKHNIKNNITNYRIYFFNDESYNAENDFRDKIKHEDTDLYKINVTSPINTDRLLIEFNKVNFLVINNIKLNKKNITDTKIHFFNSVEVENNHFFYNENSGFELNYKIKKGQAIELEFIMHIATTEEIKKIMENICIGKDRMQEELNEKIRTINNNYYIINEQNKNIDSLNKQLMDIKSRKIYKVVNKIDELRQRGKE